MDALSYRRDQANGVLQMIDGSDPSKKKKIYLQIHLERRRG
jgi:hypothetical protein